MQLEWQLGPRERWEQRGADFLERAAERGWPATPENCPPLLLWGPPDGVTR